MTEQEERAAILADDRTIDGVVADTTDAATIALASNAQPPAAQPPVVPVDDLTASFLKSIGKTPETPVKPPEGDEPARVPVSDEELSAVERQAQMDPRVGHAFSKYRVENKTLAEENEALKASLQEADGSLDGEARVKIADEIKAKETRIQELEELVGRVNLEASPAFKSRFDGRVQSVLSKLAQSLVQFASVDPDKAEEAAKGYLNATPEALTEALGDTSNVVAGMITNAWQETQGVLIERKSALDEWKNTSSALDVEGSAESTKAKITARKVAAEAALREAAEGGCFVYMDKGTPETKQAAEQYRGAFAGFVQSATEDELIRKAADGFAAPTMQYIIQEQARKIASMEGQMGAVVDASNLGVSPSRGAPPKPAPATDPRFDTDNMTELRDALVEDTVVEMQGMFRGK
jgi:hypothetical protein